MPEGPVYSGFPLAGTAASEDTAASLHKLADMLDAGEAEIVAITVAFNYYREAENEEGWELRLGLLRELPIQRPLVTRPADTEPKARRKK